MKRPSNFINNYRADSKRGYHPTQNQERGFWYNLREWLYNLCFEEVEDTSERPIGITQLSRTFQPAPVHTSSPGTFFSGQRMVQDYRLKQLMESQQGRSSVFY